MHFLLTNILIIFLRFGSCAGKCAAVRNNVFQCLSVLSNKCAECTKTVLTLVPPSIRPIIEYRTVCETIYRSVKLAKFGNMKYIHITVDIGAAEKYYRVLWNNQIEFKDVIIHLGDFHAMLHFFGNIGKFVTSSGFQDILFQAGMCSDGSIKKILSGKAYNSCWRVHEIFSEAINRLFEDAYCKRSLSETLMGKERNLTENTNLILDITEFKMYINDYNSFKEKCLDGELGATPQFWMLYQKIMDLIHQLHFSVNVNDYFLRLVTWEELLKLSFAMSKPNYSRYGSYYTMILRSIDTLHPGAWEEYRIEVCLYVETKMAFVNP